MCSSCVMDLMSEDLALVMTLLRKEGAFSASCCLIVINSDLRTLMGFVIIICFSNTSKISSIVQVSIFGFCLTYVCQSVSSERIKDANMKPFSLLMFSGPPHTIPNHVLNPCLNTSNWSGEQSEARGKGFK